MARSDDEYDLVHTFSQAKAGKSKTTKPAVREVGRDKAPVRLFVGEERGASDVRTPPSGTQFLFFDSTNGNLKRKDSTGTVTVISSQTLEDGNSPFTATATNATFNLSSDYKSVEVRYQIDNTTMTGSPLDLQVNGNSSSDYRVLYFDGTEKTGKSEWLDIGENNPNGSSRGVFTVTRTGGGVNFQSQSYGWSDSGSWTARAEIGFLAGETSDISKLKFLGINDATIEVQVLENKVVD